MVPSGVTVVFGPYDRKTKRRSHRETGVQLSV
jgi:hypothetical protein